ncbi:MAG TPA: PTS sugar transporter subunit IIA [Burkholderiaceae bacterium]|nr:PTS sugar transporter subunit IIA [Burkholderiaceae bacterium]
MLAAHLLPQDIRLGLDVLDCEQLFSSIGRHMLVHHGLDESLVAHCLSRREQAGSTALGCGVAIPHARIDGLEQIRVFYGRLRSPIHFAAPDNLPVSHVLALLVPHPAADAHLKLLADASNILSEQRFRERLSAAVAVRDVFRLFAD